MTIDRITNLYVTTPIQQPSLFLYINRLCQLPYDLMTLRMKSTTLLYHRRYSNLDILATITNYTTLGYDTNTAS